LASKRSRAYNDKSVSLRATAVTMNGNGMISASAHSAAF
jgi:hypothetical protein